jgi:hypothetical protein
MAYSKAEQQESREILLAILGKGGKKTTNVFTIVRHVSSSGMSRVIQPIVFESGRPGQPSYLGFHAARVIGWPYDRKHEGVKVSGAGMDMTFHLVYTLSQVLFKDGYVLSNRQL